MNKFILLCLCTLIWRPGQSQNLINGDLEGSVTTISILPPAWEKVLYTDPVCDATGVPQTTPDLTSIDEPLVNQGVLGYAYSGDTFISGLGAGNGVPGDYWQEGIQQEVTGFVPNEKYFLSFYQSVVKQNNGEGLEIAIDTSGSWIVFMDEELIGISVPSVSHLEFNDPNLNWEFRSFKFIATSESHVLKFLPYDDDLIYSSTDEGGGIRMGIDLIEIGLTSSLEVSELNSPIQVYPNPFTDILSVELDQFYKKVGVEILNTQGKVIHNSVYSDARKMEFFLDLPKGLYIIRINLNEELYVTKRILKE